MRISTIIPAYNRADLIGETLRSVLEQDRPPDEVIVVDDGSSDGTPEVIQSYGKAVRLIRQANAGAGAARNSGLAASTGEIVHFMDSDDLSSLNFYAVAGAAIEAGADMTYGPWLKARFAGIRLDPEPAALQQGPVPSDIPLDVASLLVEWVTVFQPCLFRRTVLERAGPYRTDLAPSEDMELLYRILALRPEVRHTPETVLLYRVHPENQVSERNHAKRLIDRANVWTVLGNHLAARSDLGGAVRRRFRRLKWDVAREVRACDPERAAALAADVPALDRALAPAREIARRIEARLRRELTGSPYPRAFAAGPLQPGQRAEIARLGYELPG